MTDDAQADYYEKGSLGYEMDRVERELRAIVTRGNPLKRLMARRQLRKLEGLRSTVATKRDEAIPEALRVVSEDWEPTDRTCPKCGASTERSDWWDDPEENGGAVIGSLYRCTRCDWTEEQ